MLSMHCSRNAVGASRPVHHRYSRRPDDMVWRGSATASTANATYTLNINNCVDKAHEAKALGDIISLSPSALQGLGPKADDALAGLHIKTVADLGSSKYFKAAKAIAVLAETEETGKRPADAQSNINSILDKSWEKASLQDILTAPPSTLQGLGPKSDELLVSLGIKSIADMAAWKYAAWAESLTVLAQFESADFSS